MQESLKFIIKKWKKLNETIIIIITNDFLVIISASEQTCYL